MKIAVISRYFPSSAEPWQGRSAYETVRLLAREAEVQVYFPNSCYPPLLKPRSRIYNRVDPAFQPAGVRVNYFNYLALPLLSRPFSGSRVAARLAGELRRFRPDILFSIFLYPDGYAAVKLGRSLGIPSVAMSIGSDINAIGDRISAMHTRTVLRESDFVVTVSEDLRQKAIRMGASPGASRCVPNGCNLQVFHPGGHAQARISLGLNPDAKTLVYIGRMDVKKGLRELVQAASSLLGSHPGLQVYMVGAGPDRELLDALIRSQQAEGSIHLMPACKPDEVAEWMRAADVVTLPSYMEGSPNVVREALACGRPVVATSVGGIPELVTGDALGCLVPPRDSAALAQALGRALGRRWDEDVISAAGSRGWDSVARELRQVFDQVLACGHTSRTGESE